MTRFAHRPVITATPDADVASVARLMRAHHVGCVVIVERKRPIGIVTDRDLALRVLAQGLPLDSPVSLVMTPDPTTAPLTAGLETMLRTLRKAGTRRLPLVNEDGTLASIVTHGDLVPLLARELQSVGEAIERSVDASELR